MCERHGETNLVQGVGTMLVTTIRRRALLIAAMMLPFTSAAQTPASDSSAGPEPLVITADFGNDAWVDGNQPIGLRLSRPLNLQNERLAVIIGQTDLSALFTVTPTVARYAANTLRLPSGETEIVVYLVSPGQPWQELARIPLRVRTRAGFYKSDIKPALTLTTSGQIAPYKNGDGTRRPPYAGVTFNPAFTTALANENGTVELQSNFLAVTKQAQALRFGAQGSRAPKFDLSDYLIKGANGPVSASVGHVSFGNAKHLINAVASRGVTGAVNIAQIAEVAVGLLNGTSIVGWDNPIGVANDNHRIIGASVKVDAIKSRPGSVLFDVSYLNGEQLPQSGFNQGDINDREKNHGAAFHFAGKLPGDRLTLDAGYAISHFENPFDPTLAQGDISLVPVRPETKAAQFADVTLAILRNTSLTKEIKVNLSTTFRHERVDPLYRSLGATVQANVLQNVIELTGGIGPLAVQASHARAEDNLDDIPSVLKTFTHVTSVNAVLPVASLFSASKPSPWFPQLTWSLSETHQFANDVPENSDFAETHAPDQMSRANNIDAQWAIGKWKAGYRYNISNQDNRQLGREKADLGGLTHNVALGVSPMSWIDLGTSYAFEGANNHELAQKNATRRFGANVDLRPTRNLGMSTVFSRTWMRDYPLTTDTDNDDVSVELSNNFRLFRSSAERPSGRVFFRYQRQSSANTAFLETIRQDPVKRRVWTLNSGVSLNAF
ncbi:MAG TPA: hypothetical protein VF042_05630 [Gemmatimonadaceae bacterium]